MPVTSSVFADREKELEILDKAWRNRPVFIVVYGRRRSGKTRLVLEWCKKKNIPSVYYHAVPARHEVNLQGLARVVEEQLGLKGFSRIRYGSLDSLLENLSYRQREALIVIDEFTYWARGSPSVSGELQRFVDHYLDKTGFVIVVVGSLVGVMYREVLGGGAPLYGRARYKIKLEELEPWYIPLFYEDMDLSDIIRLYSLLGGIPYYHQIAGRIKGTVTDIVFELFLEDNASLRDEVIFLLREEFRDPSVYYSVLQAIARGATTVSKIADYTGIHRQHLSKYLSVLRSLGFVDYRRPLFSKRGYYVVKDKVMNTWFKLVEPLISQAAKLPLERIREEASRVVDEIASNVFEEVALKYIEYFAAGKKILYDEIGRFIHKGVEVDIVAIDHENKTMHLFEVKWAKIDRKEALRITRELRRKASHIPLEYDYKLYIIAREYVGDRIDEAEVFTLKDMPFYKKNHLA